MGIPPENERVKILIDHFCNGNEYAFSREIGISQPRINRLFSIDKRSEKYPLVSFEIVQSIINKFINVSAEWILTGKGEMLKNKENELNNSFSTVESSHEIYKNDDPGKKMLLSYLNDPDVQHMIRQIMK